MFSADDTIVAIATPPGRGGIGVVRISGPESHAIARSLLQRAAPLEARRATLARVRGVDDVVATLFAGPHSYTGEDVVELSAHGSPVVLRTIVDAAVRAGARPAAPGEFTLRALLTGRLDLVQSEAVADLIDASTPLQAKAAFDQLEGTLTRRIAAVDAALFDVIARLEASLDFPDEGYHFIEPAQVRSLLADAVKDIDSLLGEARRGRLVREGAQVVVVGRPNVGKSSVFNKLTGYCRAIVTGRPGTTRDLIAERADVGGLAVTLVDTAGVRESADEVEREGVARARLAAAGATLVLVVLDQSEELREDDWRVLAETRGVSRVIVRNKIDLSPAWGEGALEEESVPVSAATGGGIDGLRDAIASRIAGGEDLREPPAITNVRHIALVERAREHLSRACEAAGEDQRTPEEFLLSDLQQARAALEEITGRRTTDDLLRHIFERFCIGK